MKCPICGTYNNNYHTYCYNCGTKLTDEQSTKKDAYYANDGDNNDMHNDNSDDLNLLFKSFKQITPDDKVKKENIVDTQNIDHKKNDIDSLYISNEHISNDEEKSLENTPSPKRKTKKAKETEDKALNLLIKICSTIIVISILLFVGLIFYDKVIKERLSSTSENTLNISATYSVVQGMIDDIPVHKIIIENSNGEQVNILNKTVPIVDGRAEIIIEDKDLMEIAEEMSSNGDMKVTLDVTLTATDAKTKLDKISFRLTPRTAPLTMIHPKTKEYITKEDSFTLLMKVTPESTVLINNDNFSDMITKDGKLEKTFLLSEEPEQSFEIKVITKGFQDNIHTITVKKANKDASNIPLTLDQKQPIISKDEWVKLTGNTIPGAKLSLDVELKQEPRIDDEGKFIIFARTANIGYTPCTLTASLDNKETTSLEIILERATDEAEYTSNAWEFVYDDITRNQSRYNGTIFLLTGKVIDILSIDGKYAFTVDISTDDSIEQLVYVEYWGNLKIEEGQRLKIFGNRWGNEGDMPKILAKFIYKSPS